MAAGNSSDLEWDIDFGGWSIQYLVARSSVPGFSISTHNNKVKEVLRWEEIEVPVALCSLVAEMRFPNSALIALWKPLGRHIFRDSRTSLLPGENHLAEDRHVRAGILRLRRTFVIELAATARSTGAEAIQDEAVRWLPLVAVLWRFYG